jgi:hypothetical protein
MRGRLGVSVHGGHFLHVTSAIIGIIGIIVQVIHGIWMTLDVVKEGSW